VVPPLLYERACQIFEFPDSSPPFGTGRVTVGDSLHRFNYPQQVDVNTGVRYATATRL
jgi:hypothetical protein